MDNIIMMTVLQRMVEFDLDTILNYIYKRIENHRKQGYSHVIVYIPRKHLVAVVEHLWEHGYYPEHEDTLNEDIESYTIEL